MRRTFLGRLAGWIGHIPQEGEGLVLEPCSSVHTFGVPVPIDVVFLDGSGTVLGIFRRLLPCRIALLRGARAAVELAGGGADGIEVGMKVDFVRRETGCGGVRISLPLR